MIDPKNKHNSDFLDFMNSNEVKPSDELNNRVRNIIQSDLNPSHKVVFSKLLGIQAFIGFLTLIFCPQFNLSLTNNFDLFHYFHHTFGENICMAICGSIFIGSGALFAAYLLKPSEVKKVRESKFLYYTSLSIIALSSFFLLGSEIYLVLTAYWLVGSILSGSIIFEINGFIRRKILHH